LNKVFMSHITDFMATGELSEALVGKGIEISKVRVYIRPHFTACSSLVSKPLSFLLLMLINEAFLNCWHNGTF
jgi:hypothetical protein